jgi:hypothetical protein
MSRQSNRLTRRLVTLLVAALLLSPLLDLHSHPAEQDTSLADVYADCAICMLLASATVDDALPSQPFADTRPGDKAPALGSVLRADCKSSAHVSYLSRAPPVTLS